MKTILLEGAALVLAKGFCERVNGLLEKRKALDAQIEEMQKASQEDMKTTVAAIKAALNVPDKDGLQIDATFLNAHGHCYALVFVHEEDGVSHLNDFEVPAEIKPILN